MIKEVAVTPTISTLIYAAGDAVGGLLEFPFAVGYPGNSGAIVGARIIDKGAQSAAMTLALFDRTFTATADQAAFAPSDADVANAIGHIEFAAADYKGGTANKVVTVDAIEMQFVPLATSLFGQLFTQGTPTYPAALDLTVELSIKDLG